MKCWEQVKKEDGEGKGKEKRKRRGKTKNKGRKQDPGLLKQIYWR